MKLKQNLIEYETIIFLSNVFKVTEKKQHSCKNHFTIITKFALFFLFEAHVSVLLNFKLKKVFFLINVLNLRTDKHYHYK